MTSVSTTALSGVLTLEPRIFADDRGFFMEAWNRSTFARAAGIDIDFVQDNHSHSVKGVLRGMHYQLDPHAQGKLVRVLAGAIFDVAVDIRRTSETFGRWIGIELNEDNKRQLWIPRGFAHGFLVLSDRADVLYKASDYYAPECDRGVRWNDPLIGIEWPIDGLELIISEKDANAPYLDDADVFD